MEIDIEKLRIVQTAGQQFLALIEQGMDGTKLVDAYQYSGLLTKAEVVNYIKKKNINDLAVVVLSGQTTTAVVELNEECKILFTNALAVFARAQRLAVKKLENETFDKLFQ